MDNPTGKIKKNRYKNFQMNLICQKCVHNELLKLQVSNKYRVFSLLPTDSNSVLGMGKTAVIP